MLLPVVALAAAIPAVAQDATTSAVRGVSIADIDFNPRVKTIRRGDTVRWTWRDGNTPHNVKSRGSLRFRSSPTKTRGTHSVRFVRGGTYRYVCSIHLNMRGRIVVR